MFLKTQRLLWFFVFGLSWLLNGSFFVARYFGEITNFQFLAKFVGAAYAFKRFVLNFVEKNRDSKILGGNNAPLENISLQLPFFVKNQKQMFFFKDFK